MNNNNDKITLTATLPPKDEMVRLEYGDAIIIDPGYIRGVYGEWDGVLEPRFDGLRCAKVLHDGDDGYYNITLNGKKIAGLGVDSGRIWLIEAEFGVYLDIDAGLSGCKILKADEYVKSGDYKAGGFYYD